MRPRRRRSTSPSFPFCALLLSMTVLSVQAATVLAKKTRLTWVNGIAHNLDHMSDGQISISTLFGGKRVEFCHNPTAMTSDTDYVGYIGDLSQAGAQKLGKITSEVDELVRHLKGAVQSVGKSGRVIHIAHSQGALITYLAARRLSPWELSRIEVIAFGGAAALRRSEFPFARCVNYYSTNDPLLAMNPHAVKALRSGFLGGMYGSSGTTAATTGGGGGGHATKSSPSPSALFEPEFVFLTPRAGDPIIDHGLLGPTYVEALAWEGRRFQRQYQSSLYRISRLVLLQSVLTCQGMTKRTDALMRGLVRHTVVPLVLFILGIVEWIKSMLDALRRNVKSKVIAPIVLMLRIAWELLQEAIRLWKGEDIYEPVSNSYESA